MPERIRSAGEAKAPAATIVFTRASAAHCLPELSMYSTPVARTPPPPLVLSRRSFVT